MNTSSAIKNAFVITCKNWMLAQPLVLFWLLLVVLLAGLFGVQKNQAALFIYSLSMVFLFIAFLSGWFFMTKKTIAMELYEECNEEERFMRAFGLVKYFFPGVGDYFLPMLGLSVIYFIFSIFTAFLIYKFGFHFIGFGTLDASMLAELQNSTSKTVLSLTPENQKVLLYWSWLIVFAGQIFQLFTMWFIPALFYNTKNPFKALFLGLKFLFGHFWQSAGIVLFLLMFHIIVTVSNSMLKGHVLLSLLGVLMFFYYATYFVVLIFLYYGQNGESKAEDYIDNGDDCDGQKLAGG